MSDNNQKFLDAYNRLDNYLRDLVSGSSASNWIAVYEHIFEEQKNSEIRQIRKCKNDLCSHGVSVGGKMPEIPIEWVEYLLNELRFCTENRDLVREKMLCAKKDMDTQRGGDYVRSDWEPIPASAYTSAPAPAPAPAPTPAPTPTPAPAPTSNASVIVKDGVRQLRVIFKRCELNFVKKGLFSGSAECINLGIFVEFTGAGEIKRVTAGIRQKNGEIFTKALKLGYNDFDLQAELFDSSDIRVTIEAEVKIAPFKTKMLRCNVAKSL